MLAIGREADESVVLYAADGSRLGEVKVTRAAGGRATLAFDLPGIKVLRAELECSPIPGEEDAAVCCRGD